MRQFTWEAPWKWDEFRRVRRNMRIASVVMAVAVLGFIPSAWILLVPTDPTLRPDITTPYAWAGLGICAVLAYCAHVFAGKTRLRFDHALYAVGNRTREIAAQRGFSLETDLGEAYPQVFISRQHRVIGVVGPSPLIVDMEHVDVEVVARGTGLDGSPRQPHLVLHLKDHAPDKVFVIPGRGLGRPNLAQVVVLAERVKDFIAPTFEWDTKTEKSIDMAAFIESMRAPR